MNRGTYEAKRARYELNDCPNLISGSRYYLDQTKSKTFSKLDGDPQGAIPSKFYADLEAEASRASLSSLESLDALL